MEINPVLQIISVRPGSKIQFWIRGLESLPFVRDNKADRETY